MVNSQQVKEIIDGFKLDLNTDKIPQSIPVIETNPKLVKTGRVAVGQSAATGAITVMATTAQPAVSDVYITGFILSLIKDAACDAATGNINLACTVGGQNTYIGYIPIITATAQQQSIEHQLSHPIKIDRNTGITVSGTFTAGVMVRTANVFYYQDEIL